MNREEYEAKVAAKKERMLARAARAAAEASAAAAAAGAIADRIPMGQPILVGHHSERKHRRDLERIDRNMRAASDAAGRAESLRRRADKVGSSIRSEDPDAVDKLDAKLAELEASRDRMKAVNAAHRRGGWDAVRAEGLLAEAQIAEVERRMQFVPGGTDKPFPSYAFSNTSAEIARVKKRIAELERGPPALAPVEGDGWRIEARPDLHRIALSFEGKPAGDIIAKLKRSGWRWSPREGAWLRMLNQAGLWAVQDAKRFLPGEPPPVERVEEVPASLPKSAPSLKSAPSAKGSSPPKSAASKQAAPKAKSASAKTPKSTTSKKPAPTPKPAAKKAAPTSKAAPIPKAAAKAKAAENVSSRAATGAEPASFSRWITHPVTRVRLDARDYGLKAWPLRTEKKA